MIQALIFSICMAFPVSVPMETLTPEPNRATRVFQETSTWKGTLDTGGPKLRLEVDVVDDGDDLTGELRSLDQNNATLELAKVKMNGRILSFTVPQIGGMFKGKLSANGTRAAGTFQQSGREFDLVLTTAAASSVAGDKTISADTLKQLGGIVEQYVDQGQALGGELQVIKNGKTVYHESFGLAHLEEKTKWENNTLCNIRSMTKPITSAAAQLLIDRHQLDLDAPVAKYLDSFDNDKSKSITVREVLTHRSGLPLTVVTTSVDQYASLAEQVAAAGEQGPEFEPGSKFWYSDAGTDVVGALVAKVSGEPLDQFVQREIFDPLDMSSTLYGFDAQDNRILSAASGYMKMRKNWTRFWKPEKPLYPFAWGSQTVYSTTTDYAKFLRMLANHGKVGDRQLLSSEAVDRMLEPVSLAKMMGSDENMPTGFRNLDVYYGQMMISYRDKTDKNARPVAIGHSGSDGTIAWAWPDQDLMILYFTQSRGGMTPLKLEDPIDRLIIHPGEDELVPERLQPYLGTYIANYDSFDGKSSPWRSRMEAWFWMCPVKWRFSSRMKIAKASGRLPSRRHRSKPSLIGTKRTRSLD